MTGKSTSPRYTKKTADEIIEHLVGGGTLTSICKKLSLTPAAVYNWTKVHTDFNERFYNARDFGDMILEDQAIDFADEPLDDHEYIETTGARKTRTKIQRDGVARSRLKAEIRLKVVARRKGARITSEIRMMKRTEAEEVAGMSLEELRDIARSRVEQGDDRE